ncbi:MAG TPA: hypothetical protein PLY79_10860 [Ferruginibacter sp.]|nr:hypothetical protein [Ferruginibacter sp.]
MILNISPVSPNILPSGYIPTWVKNNGNGYISYNGGIGADSSYLDIFFLVRSLDTNPTASCMLFSIHGPRLSIQFNSSGNMRVILLDVALTNTTLVDWTSTASLKNAGEWLFHVTANLTEGSPTFVVSRAARIAGIMQPWELITGSFSSGPTAGIIDNSRSFAGEDFSMFGSLAGANIFNAEFSFFWWSQGIPITDNAMAIGGILKNPLFVGSPVILIRGPVSNLSNDEGSANKTLTVHGSWENIGD